MKYPSETCKTRIVFSSGDSVIVDIKSTTRITEHFEIGELANWSNNEAVKYQISPKSLQFLDRMEEFRKWFGKPMKCDCNWRSVAFNASTPGAIKNSEHTKALAFDWGITGHSAIQRDNVRKKVFAMAKSYGCGCHVIYYSWGYHIDFEGKSLSVIDRR